MLTIDSTDGREQGRTPTSNTRVIFAEVAGSERNKQCIGHTLKHARAISTSSHALSNVIAALADSDHKKYIPYRESVLTRILRDSLSGTTPLVALGAISPSQHHLLPDDERGERHKLKVVVEAEEEKGEEENLKDLCRDLHRLRHTRLLRSSSPKVI